MNELALFSGAGGGILGGKLLGWRTRCAVEINAYRRQVLLSRQRDRILHEFPIWDDITTFDGKPWRGAIDIVTGGFPCQNISAAGKGEGITGKQSGLWKEMARVIGEVRPRFVLVENSPLLISRGLPVVLRDLAKMGYDARWGIVSARDAGAPHKRDRIWILAYTNCNGSKTRVTDSTGGQERDTAKPYNGSEDLANADNAGRSWTGQAQSEKRRGDIKLAGTSETVPDAFSQQAHEECEESERFDVRGRNAMDAREETIFEENRKTDSDGFDGRGLLSNTSEGRLEEQREQWETTGGTMPCDSAGRGCWWATEPGMGRMANGVAYRVDKLSALGDGQVPGVVALAWLLLSEP